MINETNYKMWLTVDQRGLIELWDGNELPPYPKFTGVWKHQDAPAISAFISHNYSYEPEIYDNYDFAPDFIQDYIDEHEIDWPNDENIEPHRITISIKEGW